ncbi:RagB/SusD family nutrient uptake outer membrane protein [Dyadobacter sp. CY312]|uniref:RagB/SusD family nutrient uptake outer membrane protein n=1 Tax=Dyadobacter sp. CY312 TaxID=2907303 RepID=UPI001F21862F|nr:RagB/SusD family nutrient uptake outer membrane protein [Dyadobacter sp. CY312]MCE7042824.1 RagB/SusD family nutrient uptake outer membrane protein [Dyadobacter sp. CY312]
MKYFRLFLISSFLFISYSCKKDPLDITPDGRITLADVFKSQELTEAYLNTTYERLRKHGCNYHYYTFLSAYGDDSHESNYPEQNFPVAKYITGNISAAENPFDNEGSTTQSYNDRNWYERSWVGIRRANVFLQNVNATNVPEAGFRGRLIAEAKILRAMFYHDLLTNYGPMPIMDKDITSEQDFSKIRRNTFEECTQFIVKDCDEAIADASLPYRVTSEAERGRMTKAVAYAVKSQILLFNASPQWNPTNDAAKWKAAADASKQALQALTANGFQLFPNYENYFITKPDLAQSPNDKETLFEINDWGYSGQTYRRFGNILFLMHMIPNFGPEKAGNCPSQELVDSYEMKNGEVAITGYADEEHLKPIINPASGYNDAKPYVDRDPRFYATVWYNGAKYGNINGVETTIESYKGGKHGISGVKQRTPTGYYMRKFVDPAVRSAAAGTTTYKQFRLAEIYLNLAEAENEANGPTPDAHNAVNTVRARAGMPKLPAGLTKDQFRERLIRERRVEFALEENRFYDMRRWKILKKVGKITSGMSWTKNSDGTLTNERIVTIRRQSWEDKFLLFPIPLAEVTKMPAFEQNAGW